MWMLKSLAIISGAESVDRRSSRWQKSSKNDCVALHEPGPVDDDDGGGVETGAVEESGNDLERREDGQLDGPCVQRRLTVQADAAVIC